MTTFRELESLIAVVELGSFEKAAASLGTSQSAISRLIKDLEGSFDQPLFNRDHRTASLTIEGQEVLTLARAILRQRTAMFERFVEGTIAPRLLRLGVTELVATTWLPRFVTRLREMYPSARIELAVGLTPYLHTLLRERRLDLAFVGEIIHFPGMVRAPIGAAKFGWYCAPQLPIPAEISVSEFERQTLLVLGSSRGTGVIVSRGFLGTELKPQNVIHCDSWAAMWGIAAAGLGVACLPHALAMDPVQRGALRRVHVRHGYAPTIEYGALIRVDSVSDFLRSAAALAQEKCNFNTPFQSDLASAQPLAASTEKA